MTRVKYGLVTTKVIFEGRLIKRVEVLDKGKYTPAICRELRKQRGVGPVKRIKT